MSRTSEFDRNEVLRKAMNVFWEGGYSKSSISNLVITTNLKPGSIYAAFKSKEGLFLETLDYYANEFTNDLEITFNKANSPLQGVKNFIERIADEVLEENQPLGCFLVNTVLETSPTDTLIIEAVNKHFEKIEDIICSALISASEQGELPVKQQPKILSQYLMVNIWGLRVLAKTKPDKGNVKAIVTKIFESLHFET